MKTEFISYEQALILKELGFDEPCFYQYVRDFDNDGELIPIVSDSNYPILRNNTQVSNCSGGDCFAAPLKQQSFEWFRDKHNLHGCVDLHVSNPTHWYIRIDNIVENDYLYHSEDENLKFKTYEEAEQACLGKLIEIVKNK